MDYEEFVLIVKESGWSASELRCDVPPSPALLDFLARVGTKAERYVERYLTINTTAKKTKRVAG